MLSTCVVWIYMRLNDYPQAEDSFRRALSLRANDANILHNYGWLMPAAKVCRADAYFSRAASQPRLCSAWQNLDGAWPVSVGSRTVP